MLLQEGEVIVDGVVAEALRDHCLLLCPVPFDALKVKWLPVRYEPAVAYVHPQRWKVVREVGGKEKGRRWRWGQRRRSRWRRDPPRSSHPCASPSERGVAESQSRVVTYVSSNACDLAG